MGRILWKVARIAAGTLLMAMAVNCVYEPMHMVTGGISGLAIAVKELTGSVVPGGLPIWLTNFVMNIPIFIWGYFIFGKKYLGYTLTANLCFTFFLFILPVVEIADQDFFLAALYGGVLTGVGLGLVFTTGYSTGGTDLLGSILHHYVKNVPVATFLFCGDALVILSGAVIFGITQSAYAVFAVYLSSHIMDTMISGFKEGKQVWIISQEYQNISQEIMRRLERGVTCLEAKGMYSGDTKHMLLCVTGRREIVRLVKIVRQMDSSAFVIIQNTREIMGEGFGKIE